MIEYSAEVAEKVCRELVTGRTLIDVCKDDGMPSEAAVRLWALEDRGPGFAAQYARAREIGYLRMADEVMGIADDGFNDWMDRQKRDGSTERVIDQEHIQRSRLRFDARRWLLSKALPKIYGDKLELGGPDGGPIQVSVVKFTEDTEK